MPGEEESKEDDKSDDKEDDDKGDDDKDDDDKKDDDDDDDDDGGGDKDGIGKKKPPDSMMVQKKSVSRSGAAAIAAQQIAEGADKMQMALTVVGLAVFVLVIVGIGGFVVWKVFVSSSDNVEQPDETTRKENDTESQLIELPDGNVWDDSSGRPPVSIVFAEDTEHVEETMKDDDASAMASDVEVMASNG
nr:pheromone-processing carboxypeptidase KEX1-like [Rhipicephalus microplus]